MWFDHFTTRKLLLELELLFWRLWRSFKFLAYRTLDLGHFLIYFCFNVPISKRTTTATTATTTTTTTTWKQLIKRNGRSVVVGCGQKDGEIFNEENESDRCSSCCFLQMSKCLSIKDLCHTVNNLARYFFPHRVNILLMPIYTTKVIYCFWQICLQK